MQLAFSCFSKLSSIPTGLTFFSLVYSLKWLSSEVHLPILLISRREYRSTTVCATNLAKIYTRILKYTKMNCCRNAADKFDRSSEDEKKSKTFAVFFSAIQRSYGNQLIVEIVRDRQDR